MKTLFFYIWNFVKEDFSFWAYLYTGIFLFLTIRYNYENSFYRMLVLEHRGTLKGVGLGTLFFGVAYYGILLPKLILAREWTLLSRPSLYIRSFFLVGVVSLAIFTDSRKILDFLTQLFDVMLTQDVSYFSFFQISHLKLFSIWGGGTLLLYALTRRTFRKPRLYGLNWNPFSFRIYILMFLFMIPLLYIASLQESFLTTYPLFKFERVDKVGQLEVWQLLLIFELVYALAFIGTEMLFRGAFILGFVDLLGRHAVLPMASIYCFIHFNKPFLETVSSIFGGYILGILALATYNIVGGIIIHVGIAWGMDTLSVIRGERTLF